MRLRRAITAAYLIVLSVPAISVSAAQPRVAHTPTLHSGAAARNLDVERSLLRALMAQRRDLIARMMAPNGERGRVLALTMLQTADAVLSRDAAALASEAETARQAQRRAAAMQPSQPTVFTPAAPGELWAPTEHGLAPGVLDWSLTASVAPTARTSVAPPLTMSLAALTSWAASLPAGSQGNIAPQAGTASDENDTTAPPRLAPLGDPALLPAEHGSLTVDSGSGAAPIAAVNTVVSATLIQPAVPISRTIPRADAPAHPPDPDTLERRQRAIAAALERVRTIESWLKANAPSAILSVDDIVTSPDALQQRLDHWIASVPLEASAGAAAPQAMSQTPAPAILAQRLSAFEHVALTQPTQGLRPHATTANASMLDALPAALGATLALSTEIGGAGSGVSLDAALGASGTAAIITSTVGDAVPNGLAANSLTLPAPLAATPTATATATISATASITPAAAISATAPATVTTTTTITAAPLVSATGSAAPTANATSVVSATIAAANTVGPAASSSATATATPIATDSATATTTPIATDSATATATPTPSATPSPTPTDTAPPTATPTNTPRPTPTATPMPTDTATPSPSLTATTTPSATTPITATPHTITTMAPATATTITPSVTAAIPATTPLSATPTVTQTAAPTTTTTALSTPATTPISASAPITPLATLDMLIGATPALTITTDVSTTAPLTLVVTLPVSSAQSLAPADFLSERGALESVLRQGQALFNHLQAAQADAESAYHRQLSNVVAINSLIEQHWLSRLNAYNYYHAAYPAYWRRKITFDAYAHRLHLAQLGEQQWQQRIAAWTRYAQQLKAYRDAQAARQHPPTAPISGTVALTSTVLGVAALPAKPIAPPFPGSEPPPFTESPPPWPGAAPLFATNPGPEPRGLSLPLPPEAVPPWDGEAQLISVVQFDGTAAGVGAVGREETTQANLLAAGAFDVVGGYQDPVRGPITTYWGGSTIFQAFHAGVDIAAPMFTPIHAAADGVVTWAGYAVPGQRHESYGLCIIIQHNSHVSTLYAHMDDTTYGLSVRVGDIVRRGQVIGHVGLTGWTTGPHLHFEMRENNVQFNPLLLIPNPAS